jgi:hypothetical protein
MERWESTQENRVEYNLSESGVHPLSVSELLENTHTDILKTSLGYIQTNGSLKLRETIAGIYERASPENLLVTNGSAEAIFVTLWSFLESGAEIVVMLPNYMQIWGLAKTFRARLKTFWLRENAERWVPDLRALKKAITKRTKLITICNPNNPTGTIMPEEEMDTICKIAGTVGAWILSDEVYQGAEISDKLTPSFWGKYKKTIITNGLSKAYGLPGLRIGWLLTTSELAKKLWAYHDYTTIAPTALSDQLAQVALETDARARILSRSRQILLTNLPVIHDWVDAHASNFSFIPPRAGAIAYLKYNLKINSTTLAKRLVKEKSTLIVPGDQFGMDGYMRIGYGSPKDYLVTGLSRIDDLVAQIRIGKER